MIFLAPGAARAAALTWSIAITVTNDSDVVTAGTPVYAYDWANSNQVVNGVTFTGTSSASGGTNISLTDVANNYGSYSSISNPYAALSTAYKSILTGGEYANNALAATVTLKNLTIGHVYIVQLWIEDARAGVIGRTGVLTGANTVTLIYNTINAIGGVGQYSIGEFTADGTNQTFTVTGNASTQLNTLQVRDVTGAGYTPPPPPPLVPGIWLGGSTTTSYWSDTNNWSGEVVFTTSNSVTFNGATRQANTNDLTGLVLTGITFNTAGWSIQGNPVVFAGSTLSDINSTNYWGLNTTLSNTMTVINTGNTTLSGYLSGPGGIGKPAGDNSGDQGVGGLWLLNPTNSFTGNITIDSGTLYASTLAPGGQPSSLGAGTDAINIGFSSTSYGGALAFIGTNNCTTDRPLTFAGASGSGQTMVNYSPNNSSMEFDGAITLPASPLTLNFSGTSTGTNTLTGQFNSDNNVSDTVNVNGPGTWSFTKGIISTANFTVANNGHFVLGYDGSGLSDLVSPVVTVRSGSTFDVSAYDANNDPFVVAQISGYTQTLIAGRTNGTAGTDIYGSLNLGGAGGAVLNLGGTGVPSTLGLTGGLIPASGSIDYDLAASATAGSGVNDLIQVGGNLDLSQGSATIYVNELGGVINTNANTYYTLMTYTGSLIGNASGLSVPSPGREYTAGVVDTSIPGLIRVSFGPSGLAADNLVWQGNVNGNWDLQATANWLDGANASDFYAGDNVIFNDTASQTSVNLVGALAPGVTTVSNNVSNYAFTSTSSGSINSGSLLKQGSGKLSISTANGYSGGTVASAGILSAANATAFGSGTVTVGDINTGTNTAMLMVSNAVNISNPIMISSNAPAGNLVLGLDVQSGGDFSGLVTLQRSVTLSNGVPNATLFNLGGIDGNGNVILNGDNTNTQFHWQGPSPTPTTVNYYMTGNIILTNGAFLDTQGGAIITNTASLIMASNTTFAIALNPSPYNNQVINALIGSGRVESGPGVTWNLVLTIGAGNGSGIFSGSISNYQAYYVGLIKSGTGTETFTGNNGASSGFTTVSNGILAVDNTFGSGLGSGTVFVSAGATLAGNGAIVSGTNTVTVNGVLAAGSPGEVSGSSFNFTNTGGLLINSGGALSVSLFSDAGDNTGNAAAADMLVAQCPVTLNSGAVLDVSNPNSLAFAAGDKWKIANWSTTPTNTFTTLNLPALASGLSWDTSSLYSTGVIDVVSSSGPTAPANITGVTVSGGSLILTGTNLNGGQNFHYEVLSSTNLALPLTNWLVLSTNSFNANGTFNYTNVISLTNPAAFFDVKAVQ